MARAPGVPRIDLAKAEAIVLAQFTLEDGGEIPPERASRVAWDFFRHCTHELAPAPHYSRPRRQPIKPTAERLRRWVMLESDFWPRSADRTPVRRRNPGQESFR